ncbi:MAG: hypothetical protein ABJG88_04680, partial [Litorimonas sp.]
MLGKLLEPLLFKKLGEAIQLYKEEEYEKILRFYDKPVICSQPSDVYRNIVRICCLLRNNS